MLKETTEEFGNIHRSQDQFSVEHEKPELESKVIQSSEDENKANLEDVETEQQEQSDDSSNTLSPIIDDEEKPIANENENHEVGNPIEELKEAKAAEDAKGAVINEKTKATENAEEAVADEQPKKEVETVEMVVENDINPPRDENILPPTDHTSALLPTEHPFDEQVPPADVNTTTDIQESETERVERETVTEEMQTKSEPEPESETESFTPTADEGAQSQTDSQQPGDSVPFMQVALQELGMSSRSSCVLSIYIYFKSLIYHLSLSSLSSLSLSATIVTSVSSGIKDSMRFKYFWFTFQRSKTVKNRTYDCLILNGLLMLCVRIIAIPIPFLILFYWY